MKLIFKEHSSINYNRYEFPYCIYCIKENGDTYNEIYSKGFLPFSNDLNIEEEIYYLARSIRYDLKKHKLNSIQKYVINKYSKAYNDENIEFKLCEKQSLLHDEFFLEWCINNAKNNFLTPERLTYILSRPYLKNILTVTYNNNILAYIFIVTESHYMLHVWYSFYDLNIKQNDFGKWILLKTIEWSKTMGYDYFYIGTCYSKSAFYKLTLSPNTEYFNGTKWDEDVSLLKKRLIDESA